MDAAVSHEHSNEELYVTSEEGKAMQLTVHYSLIGFTHCLHSLGLHSLGFFSTSAEFLLPKPMQLHSA